MSPSYIEPIFTKFRDWTVYELPPNGDGIGALEMLNIMEQFKPGCLTIDVRQMKTVQILGGVWYWWWLYSLSFNSRGGLGVTGLCGRFPKADTGSIGGFRLTRREVIPLGPLPENQHVCPRSPFPDNFRMVDQLPS